MTWFWIAAATLTAAVVLTLLRPLLRGAKPVADRAAYDLEVHRDQLAEVDRDLARGVIEPAQAEAARAEIGRRILAAAPPDTAPASLPTPGKSRRVALAVVVTVPLATLATYLAVGRPDLPGQPLADRIAAARDAAPPAAVVSAVAHLAERLQKEPNNLEGWVLLAQSQAKLGRPAEAVEAWRHAAALAPDNQDIQGDFAEALTAANQGLVSEEAARLFEAMLAKTPNEPRASHYLALSRAQAGDFKGALDRWVALAAASPADAPWLPLVGQRVADMAARLNLDAATVMPKPLPPKGAASDGGAPASDERVRAMVDKLAARLQANPGDVSGWLRLAHAYEVLGDTDKQLGALKRARDVEPRNVDVLVSYAAAILARDPPADSARLPAEAAQALATALEIAPDTQAALWYLGIDAANAGKPDAARVLWKRLLGALDPSSPDYAEVKTRLDALK